MHSRSAVIAFCALALAATPALARAEPASAESTSDIADRLNDPMTQYAVAGAVSAASKALLDMPVAPLVEAVEKSTGRRPGNLPRDARVSDLAGLDHARVRDRIVEHVPRAMAAMGALAEAAEAMTPELKRVAKSMRESIPRP
jgi:hypothetical protein